jgi:hypothetical protein
VASNLSDSNFLARLLNLLPVRGEPMVFSPEEEPEEEKKNKDIVKRNAIATKEKLAKDLINAESISEEVYNDIRERRQADKDITEAEQL